MNISRKHFIQGSAALLAGAAFAELPTGKPKLRIGVMTDTHVGKTVESCIRVRRALELFRDQGAELVINNGDIADHHYPTGYRAYRQVFNEVYTHAARPKELYAYAWHDAFDFQGHARNQVVPDAPVAFEEVRRLLEAPNGHTAELVLNDYVFLVMPQFTGSKGFLSWDEYEAKIAAACKANPGRPVFVVDHVPPLGTVYESVKWGSRRTRQIMDKYPQVVHFSGHVHGSLRNDLLIWQQNFTVINAGCLFGWGGLLAGTHLGYDKQEWGVLVVDVHEDRLVVRRWDVRDGTEIGAAHPWIVPLPFVAATAPYRRASCRAAEARPVFAAGAQVSVAPVVRKTFEGLRVEFPDAAPGAMIYRVSAARRNAAGAWENVAVCETFSEYTKHPKDRTGKVQYVVPEGYFAPSTTYRISVTPVNQYGDVGASISTETTTPAAFAPRTVLWQCADPMRELRFAPDWRGAKPCVADANGFYGPLPGGRLRLTLPDGIFKAEPGTRLRLLVDVHTRCEAYDEQPTVILTEKGKAGAFYGGEYNGFGDVRSLRMLDVKVEKDSPDSYDLEFRDGAGGQVRFDGLTLVRLG